MPATAPASCVPLPCQRLRPSFLPPPASSRRGRCPTQAAVDSPLPSGHPAAPSRPLPRAPDPRHQQGTPPDALLRCTAEEWVLSRDGYKKPRPKSPGGGLGYCTFAQEPISTKSAGRTWLVSGRKDHRRRSGTNSATRRQPAGRTPTTTQQPCSGTQPAALATQRPPDPPPAVDDLRFTKCGTPKPEPTRRRRGHGPQIPKQVEMVFSESAQYNEGVQKSHHVPSF